MLLTATLLVAGLPASRDALPAAVSERVEDPPNIVLVMTDDQNDYELDEMPLTRAALQDDGMDFVDAVSPHPLCCPARAEILTGQYAQNNGVRHNNGQHGGFDALDPSSTLATWFREGGYATAFVGKYLNKYGPADGPQEGWDRWHALTRGVYSYQDFSLADGDREQRYRDAYVSDVISEQTTRTARELAAGDRPFLLLSWHLAPHYRFSDSGERMPPLSAPEDRDSFTEAEPVSIGKPSFSMEQDAEGTQVMARPHPRRLAAVRAEHRARLRSLQAVDRSVADLVTALKEEGVWEDTYLFFTSDNGFLLGEHHLIGKNVLLEEALQIPLLVAGGGVRHGSSAAPVSLVDLPATFVDLAGLTPDASLDGLSLAPLLRGETGPWRDTTLVQTGRTAGDGWEVRGVRTHRYLYAVGAEGRDEVLIDRLVDPFELTNRVEDPFYAGTRDELRRRRDLLVDCAGADCNRVFGPVPDPLTELDLGALPRRIGP